MPAGICLLRLKLIAGISYKFQRTIKHYTDYSHKIKGFWDVFENK